MRTRSQEQTPERKALAHNSLLSDFNEIKSTGEGETHKNQPHTSKQKLRKSKAQRARAADNRKSVGSQPGTGLNGQKETIKKLSHQGSQSSFTSTGVVSKIGHEKVSIG